MRTRKKKPRKRSNFLLIYRARNAYWSKGPWSFNARENFYGSSYAYSQNGIDGKYYQQVTASAFLTDLEGSYDFVIHHQWL